MCSSERPFVCYGDNLLFITEKKTWEDALNHCRSLSTSYFKYDLLSLSTSQSLGYIRDRIYKATTDQVGEFIHFLSTENKIKPLKWFQVWTLFVRKQFSPLLCVKFPCVLFRFGQVCASWEKIGFGQMEAQSTSRRCCPSARPSGNSAALCPKTALMNGWSLTALREKISYVLELQ